MKRALFLPLLLAGCTVGPDYREPSVAIPASYSEARQSGDAQLDRWWQGFNDPQLTALTEQAFRQNLDIEMAAARIREARAQEGVAGAGRLPEVGAEASVTRQRISENAIPVPPGSGAGGGSIGLPGSEFTSWRAGFDASWELDFFGRNRRERQAASARTGTAVWNRRDAEVSVAAEVASSYLSLRTLQARIANAEAELARQQRFEQLVRAQAKGGLVTGQELEQRRSERSVAAAAIPPLQARAKAEIHALGVLTGQAPESLANQLAAPTAALAPLPPSVPPGLPSDLLRRRPDIRAAERELAAATADIGVAVADLYPRISLTAAPALVSTALGSLLEWGSRSFSAGAALDWPIFDGGRRKANIEVRNARQEQAAIAYRKAVLTALQDVEDGLANLDGDRRKLDELEQARANAARAEDIADTRYKGGLVTMADMLQAQQRRLSLEEQMIETKGAVARDTVALVKALGGGWQELEQ